MITPSRCAFRLLKTGSLGHKFVSFDHKSRFEVILILRVAICNLTLPSHFSLSEWLLPMFKGRIVSNSQPGAHVHIYLIFKGNFIKIKVFYFKLLSFLYRLILFISNCGSRAVF